MEMCSLKLDEESEKADQRLLSGTTLSDKNNFVLVSILSPPLSTLSQWTRPHKFCRAEYIVLEDTESSGLWWRSVREVQGALGHTRKTISSSWELLQRTTLASATALGPSGCKGDKYLQPERQTLRHEEGQASAEVSAASWCTYCWQQHISLTV